MTDYSQHLIKTQQLIRLLYEDCQSLKYVNAMETCLQAVTELKLAYNAIHDLVDKREPNAMIGMWDNKYLSTKSKDNDSWKLSDNDQA